jgi:hypothetical protein
VPAGGDALLAPEPLHDGDGLVEQRSRSEAGGKGMPIMANSACVHPAPNPAITRRRWLVDLGECLAYCGWRNSRRRRASPAGSAWFSERRQHEEQLVGRGRQLQLAERPNT